MSTRAKKTRLSISVDPDLVEKLTEAAEESHGGNVSRLITAVLWKEFLGKDTSRRKETMKSGNRAADASTADEEVERCHRLLLRLREERRLPSWASLEVGEITVDGQAFPYVKKWVLDASTTDVPANEVVKALTRWAGKKQ